METLKGSCLCGGVTYEIEGGVGDITYCHCTMCQKAHGSAFGAYAPVGHAAFKFHSGEALVLRHRSSQDVTRTFCGACGATLQFIRDGRPGFGIAVGTLDADPLRRPVLQIFTGSKAPWHTVQGDVPAHETRPHKPKAG